MEDKLSTLLGLCERLLQAQAASPQTQLDAVLVEAMERFERDLPLTIAHVARLLDVSTRTVRRLVPVSARSKPGGTAWYSRREVETVWRARAGSGTRPRSSKGQRSARKLSSSSHANSTADDASVAAVETRLREGLSKKPHDSSPMRLRLIVPPRRELPPK